MNRKYTCIILMLVIIFISAIAHAQPIVKGKVVDMQSRLPLEGVTVTLLPARISMVTDQLGNFVLDDPKKLAT